MTQFETQAYGISEQQIRERYMQSITARHSGMEMLVMSILSDAQEMLAMGEPESARKQMNIAKFVLSEMQDARQ